MRGMSSELGAPAAAGYVCNLKCDRIDRLPIV
jgi:hypothetical protein